MSKVFMWCYSPLSEGGKLLAEKLGILRIKHENSTFVGNPSHTVVNWGASLKRWGPKGYGFKVINDPNCVSFAVNKYNFFQRMASVLKPARVPDWTASDSVAKSWLDKGFCVIGRQILEGMGGEGIVVMEKPVDLVPCKLYTKYIEKEREFRVYVVAGKMVDFCSKRRKYTETPKNWKIRSRENGFVFCWEDQANLPSDCVVQSVLAIKALGLDFGGVDVIFSEKEGKAYVLEVNTAPWLSEYTAEIMAKAIQENYLAA